MLLIRKILVPILVLILVISLLASTVTFAAESGRTKEIIIKRIMDDATAVEEIRAGKSDGRFFPIPTALAAELEAEGVAQIVTSWTGMTDILTNPVPRAVTGKFNPFEYREVRYALNFLVDRTFIVDEVYMGAAIPIIAPVADNMPGYVETLPVLGKYRFVYDFVKAYQLINDAMRKAGATKTPEGYWAFEGEIVTVKFIIRIEDERRQIGDMLADQLEKVGFKVERLYKDFMAALTLVYMTDPADLEWHLYTEGWWFSIGRYSEYDFIWFYSSIWGAMPGWLEPAYWNYRHPEIDEVAEKLEKADYTTNEERLALFRKLADLGMYESVRIFIAVTGDTFSFNPKMEGICNGPAAMGPVNVFTMMLAHVPGKDTLVFSNRYVYAAGWAWNPIAGHRDAYSRPVEEAVYGLFGTGLHPLTVLPGFQLMARYGIETDMVEPKITVPEGVWTYDPEAKEWVEVPAGTKAYTKVIYNYPHMGKMKFHDLSPVTLADILANIAFIIDWGTGGDDYSDPRLIGWYSYFVTTFVGVRVINSTAIELYSNLTHVDPDYLAAMLDVWTDVPLELRRAMEIYVGDLKKAAFSDVAARARGVDWLHLLSPIHSAEMLDALEAEGTNYPQYIRDLIEKFGVLTEEEYLERISNLREFYNTYGHVEVGTGPYFIADYDPTTDTVTLRRFSDVYPDYPLSWQDLSFLARIKSEHEVSIELPKYFGIGPNPVNVTVTEFGEPLNEAEVFVLLYDREGNLLGVYEAVRVGDGLFQAFIPINETGTYKVMALAYSLKFFEPRSTPIIEKAALPFPVTPPTPPPTTPPPTTPPPTTPPPPPPPPPPTTPPPPPTVPGIPTVTVTHVVTETKTELTTLTVTKTVVSPSISVVSVPPETVTTEIIRYDLIAIAAIVGLIIGLIPSLLRRK